MVSSVIDYLTGRLQYVMMQNCVSDRVVGNTGAPQGTVLFPFCFALYTTDFCYPSESSHLQKFSDDSATVECIIGVDESKYRAIIDDFVKWGQVTYSSSM